jgi:hypothetical protein
VPEGRLTRLGRNTTSAGGTTAGRGPIADDTKAAGQPVSGITPEPRLLPAFYKPRLRRSEASTYLEHKHGLAVAPATLAKLACIGGGPAFHKAGRTPLYPREELDRWAVERLGRLLRNTSEVGGR